MLALIGSAAAIHHGLDRNPKDMDIIGSYDEVARFVKTRDKLKAAYPTQNGEKWVYHTANEIIEAEIAWEGSLTERLLNLIQDDPETNEKDGFLIPSLNVLYMLKMSHRFLKNSPHFLKTMRDIHAMRKLGARIHDMNFFKEREKATYVYDHPKLNVAKKDFFTGDGVDYQFDHDSIHESMAQLEKPAYRFYQPETSQVNVSKLTFFAQSEQIRLFGVLEESYVLALERSQIPFRDKIAPKQSFDIALKKVCTSITSGFFREYSWEHYDEVQALYNENYVDRFWKAVKEGIVKPYK